ncbi:MAG: TetR/AcrR family transcriptional regulator [Phycisphaerae bacterium]|nr:TetR/AcrR family transcriptional regulator [Tepidisphaeraceae bacterium]
MQRPDEKKRQQIVRAAARLFATRPFHKVKLDDVAAAAAVGKGTLYVYFQSKDDLYYSLIYEGFAQLVDRLAAQFSDAEPAPREGLRTLCREVVGFGFANPHFFELIRAAGGTMRHPRWEGKRRDLVELIERTIRRGVAAGDFDDPHPEITAVCIPGLIRSIMLYAPKTDRDEDVVAGQIVRWVERGVGAVADTAGVTRRRVAPSRGKTTARRPTLASGRNGR